MQLVDAIRSMGDVSDRIGRPSDNGQVCMYNSISLFVLGLSIGCLQSPIEVWMVKVFWITIHFCSVPSHRLGLLILIADWLDFTCMMGCLKYVWYLNIDHYMEVLVWYCHFYWNIKMIYCWLFYQVIPFDSRGQLKEAFNIR